MSFAKRLCVAADHQRHRERPRLGREIGHRPARNAGFLQRLAPHRLLDRFARLDKAREARPHAGAEAALPAEQAALAIDRQHDHHRIGAREVLRLAARTVAPPTGVRHVPSACRNWRKSDDARASVSIAFASASAATCSGATSPWIAIERRSMTRKSGLILERFRRRLIDRRPRTAEHRPAGRETRSRARARAHAPRPSPNNACGSLALRSTTSSPPITIGTAPRPRGRRASRRRGDRPRGRVDWRYNREAASVRGRACVTPGGRKLACRSRRRNGEASARFRSS